MIDLQKFYKHHKRSSINTPAQRYPTIGPTTYSTTVLHPSEIAVLLALTGALIVMKAFIICIYLSKATFSDFYSIYAIDVVTLSHFKSINAIDVTRVKC